MEVVENSVGSIDCTILEAWKCVEFSFVITVVYFHQ